MVSAWITGSIKNRKIVPSVWNQFCGSLILIRFWSILLVFYFTFGFDMMMFLGTHRREKDQRGVGL